MSTGHTAWILCMAVLLCSACVTGGPRRTAIVAHRGASHDAPENTLAAFKLAWKQGADIIEGDFYLTRDGEIACIHDKTTKRTCGKNLTVKDATMAELKALEAGSWKAEKWRGEPIPTLREVLDIVPPGKKILIEIKCGPEIMPALKKALDASKLKPSQTIIIAFNAEVVARFKRLFPNRKAYWLTGFKQDKKTGRWSPTQDEIMATLERIKADGLDCNAHDRADKALVKKLRDKGLEFHVWTVNKLDTALRFQALGVDSITTDRPGWLKEKLAKAKGAAGL